MAYVGCCYCFAACGLLGWVYLVGICLVVCAGLIACWVVCSVTSVCFVFRFLSCVLRVAFAC